MTEIQILSAIENNGGCIDYVELLNIGKADPKWEPEVDRELVEVLLQAGTIKGKAEAFGAIAFGRCGRLRLRELEEHEDNVRKQRAGDKADKRMDKKFQLFLTLIGPVVTIIVEYLVRHVFKLF